MSDINKKKLFIPRKLSDDDSRYAEWNNKQPIVDGVRINQYDSEGRKQGYWEEYWVGTNKLNSKGFYKDDKQDGVWKHYHHKGDDILWYEESHKNGKLIKTLLYYYDDNGNIVDRKIYGGNGKLIKSLPITESKKLFIPRKLSGEGSRWSDWNKEQPIVDGVRINQYDMDGRKTGIWESYHNGKLDSKGSYKDDKKEGIWESYWSNGQLFFKRSYKDGEQDGIWEEYYSNGQLRKKGPYKDGKQDGIWEEYDEDGRLSGKGLFKNGNKDGIWEKYYNNGKLSRKGLFKDGKQDGILEWYHKNGELWCKELYDNGKQDGISEYYDEDGKLESKGSYKDGEKDGIWEEYFPNGGLKSKKLFDDGELIKELPITESKQLYVKGKYVKDIPLTESKKIFIPRKLSDDDSRYSEWNNKQPVKDGEKINQYDSEGRKQGYWEHYANDDEYKRSGSYINDKKEGVWEWFWDNNQLWNKGLFVNDQMEGIWEYYDILGKLFKKRLFKNGKLAKDIPLTESKKLFIPRKLSDEDSRYSEWNKEQPIVDGERINQFTHNGKKTGIWEEYYSNGQLYKKGLYVNGLRDGYFEYYGGDGELLYKGYYKDDKMDGIWEEYHINGKLHSKGPYKDDLKDGIWEEYYINGNLEFKGLYKDDELVKILPLYESKTPSFLLKEEMGLIREGNVQDYINNVISKIKNLPYETKKKYLTIAISTLLGYTSYPTIQTIFNNLPDKEVKEIVHKIMKKKDKKSIFNDGTKLRLSQKGFRHIMDEEQPKLVAYSLGDGKITIGYGHAEPVETTKLKVGDKITKEQAKIYLKEDLKIAADGVRRMFRDWKKQNKNYKVTQDMFDALVSMAFNIGVSGLRNTTFVDYLRDGNYKTAGRLIKQTKINNDTFPGLEKRRNRESDMFLSYLSKNNKINV